jgi:hypothetical protein
MYSIKSIAKEEKSQYNIGKYRKSACQNPTFIHNKNRKRRKHFQLNKEHPQSRSGGSCLQFQHLRGGGGRI